MRARHVGPLLAGSPVGARRHQDEVALLAVDPHEGCTARLGREVAFGDTGSTAFLADQTHQSRATRNRRTTLILNLRAIARP